MSNKDVNTVHSQDYDTMYDLLGALLNISQYDVNSDGRGIQMSNLIFLMKSKQKFYNVEILFKSIHAVLKEVILQEV